MILFLRLMAFLLILLGSIFVLKIDVIEFLNDLSGLFTDRKKLKARILIAKGKKKKSAFYLLIEDTKAILKLNGKEEIYPRICILSIALAIAGALLGFTISNYFIVPILCMGMCILPFVYIKYLGIRLKKLQNEELETALSIITSSYIRSEDILTAVEENKDYINPPVKEVFEQFVLEASLVDPDIKKLVHGMKHKIDNSIFHEWCDAIVACQDDGALKSTLTPIVKKCSNIRIVSVRLDSMLYAPMKEYITMVLLLVLNVPLMRFLNKSWFHILLFEIPGKIILAVCSMIILVSAIGVIKISKPIEYKR
jgi:tight adherence protein B